MTEFTVITLFPDLVSAYFSRGIVGRAAEAKVFSLNLIDLREFGEGSYNKCDDTLYGGGRGMLLMPDPADKAMGKAARMAKEPYYPIFLSPAGKVFDQAEAARLAKKKHLLFFCGHYEGVDARFVEKHAFNEISLGDFVLTGGEAAALCVMDATIRLLSGALPDAESHEHESFSLTPASYAEAAGPSARFSEEPLGSPAEDHAGGSFAGPADFGRLLEERQYTKPAEWQGLGVPEALKSGSHALINEWRLADSLWRTVQRRPDLPNYAKWTCEDWLLFLKRAALEESAKDPNKNRIAKQ